MQGSVARVEGCVCGAFGCGEFFFDFRFLRFEGCDLLFELCHLFLRFSFQSGKFLSFFIGAFPLGDFRVFLLRRFRCGECFVAGGVLLAFLVLEEVLDAADVLADVSSAKLIDSGNQSFEEISVVADDNHRAVEGGECLLQDVLGSHVEVVRRFVENQEVHGFQQEANHGEAGTLTPGEHFHLFVRRFAAKHERPEDVSDFGAYVSRGDAVNRVEDGEFTVQKLCLILSVVANLHAVSEFECAFEIRFPHETLHPG